MISFRTLDLDLRRVQFKSIFKLVSSYHKEHIMLFKSTVIFSLIQTTLRYLSVVINYLQLAMTAELRFLKIIRFPLETDQFYLARPTLG